MRPLAVGDPCRFETRDALVVERHGGRSPLITEVTIVEVYDNRPAPTTYRVRFAHGYEELAVPRELTLIRPDPAHHPERH